MQVGLAWVGLVLLWERAAYPGLLDFSARYRTTATFWEMHVGGAAIDAYLALATPFAAWALVSARSPRAWVAAAALALLTGHACLTTFSRGAYVGVALPLFLLGVAWWSRRLHSNHVLRRSLRQGSVAFAAGAAALLIVGFLVLGYGGAGLVLLGLSGLILAFRWRARALPWRRAAAMALTLALITEAVAVIGGGSFMRSRLDASEGDFGARLAHWRHGIGLLHEPRRLAGRHRCRAAAVPVRSRGSARRILGSAGVGAGRPEPSCRSAFGPGNGRRSRRPVLADAARLGPCRGSVPGESAASHGDAI